MSTASYSALQPPLRARLAYLMRVLRVMASIEFKIKYVDSALGYVWSLAKPLTYFAVLWVVFGRFFDTGISNFPLYLLIGIVLFTFFTDAVGMMLPSIVTRGAILRRMAFPPLVIPISASLTASMTFCVNLVAVTVFIAASRVQPSADWLLVVPLLLELYLFIVGVGLIIATLFVRFRDMGPLWELVAQLLLFASPIMYPITILPEWAQKIALANPFVQVLQDIRLVVLGKSSDIESLLVNAHPRILPISIAVATLLVGLWLYRRDSPRFAERV
jgi:ABC-2 type transport system permease protein